MEATDNFESFLADIRDGKYMGLIGGGGGILPNALGLTNQDIRIESVLVGRDRIFLSLLFERR